MKGTEMEFDDWERRLVIRGFVIMVAIGIAYVLSVCTYIKVMSK